MTCGAVRVPMRRTCRVFPVLERCVGAPNGQKSFVRTTTDVNGEMLGTTRVLWSSKLFYEFTVRVLGVRLQCARQGIKVGQL